MLNQTCEIYEGKPTSEYVNGLVSAITAYILSLDVIVTGVVTVGNEVTQTQTNIVYAELH